MCKKIIESNYSRIQQSIAAAAEKCGRQPGDIKLIAVTKTVGWPEANVLYDMGQRDFGENRLHQAFEKMAVAPQDCAWHLIGTLQSNKVAKAIGHFPLIHSVDSLALAQKISQQSQKANLTTSILLQVNTSGEISKHGMTPQECRHNFEQIAQLPALSIQGLMTMAPFSSDEKLVRSCFAGLRQLRDALRVVSNHQKLLPHLSMGMSHDFQWAIAEGATIVRIGTALFSP